MATGSNFVVRIGELAKQAGCPVETIRYYEEIQLLPPVGRSPNGYRHYSNKHRKWLLLILKSRALGFTQDQVRQLTGLANHENVDCQRVHAVVMQHLTEIEAKQRELATMERALKRLADKCSNALVDCPVIDELMTE